MPALTDPRWENVCQLRAAGGEIGASYTKGGFTGNASAATAFFRRPVIMARIAEIQDQRFQSERKVTEIAIKKAGLEDSWIIERVKFAIEIALRGEPILNAQGQPTGRYGKRQVRAAIDGLRLAADIKGLRIQRVELGAPGDFARMTDEELNEALLEQSRALGLPDEAVMPLLIEHKPGEDTVQ